MLGEQWIPVLGYEGLYSVSSQGKVRSEDRIVPRGKQLVFRKSTPIKPVKESGGHLQVQLYRDGKPKYMLVHRLMAIAFLENPDNLPQINHINGVKTDNRIENLEWCSASKNAKHAYDLGLNPTKGVRHHLHKLTEDDVREIRNRWALGKETQKQIGDSYEVSKGTIRHIVIGNTWKHII